MSEPITFEEPTVGDSFEDRIRELDFIAAPSGPIYSLPATPTERAGGERAETPSFKVARLEYEQEAPAVIPFGSRPSSPVPDTDYLQAVLPISPGNENRLPRESSLPPYSSDLLSHISAPATPAWKQRLDLLAQHINSPGSVPELTHPYWYKKIPEGWEPSGVFKYKKDVCCVKCGLPMKMCGSNDKVCQSVKRRKTNLIEKYAVSNGEGTASSSSSSDAEGVTQQAQRMELFRAARENPDRFPLVNME